MRKTKFQVTGKNRKNSQFTLIDFLLNGEELTPCQKGFQNRRAKIESEGNN